MSEVDFPATGSPRQKLEFALTYATLAPTAGNWQPWYFRLTETRVDLMAKKNPSREEIDPDRREFMLGCGSALLYLKHTLKHFGCLGRVELFPDLGQPELVAQLHFGTGRERDAREKLLFDAMPKSPASPSPLGEPPVTAAMLSALAHAATGERGWLDFVQSEIGRRQVLEVTLAQPRPGMNSAYSNRPAMTETADESGERLPPPVFAFGDRAVDVWKEPVEPDFPPAVATATLAVVKTKTDDKHGWLEAGQTMARTILQAQALGLSWAFFDPVRRRDARAALRTAVGRKGFAQVILRFGPLLTDDQLVGLAAPVVAPQVFR
ncbi:MAG: hypothetical protein P4N60_13825 [Verrucomicrobiae bacterium]|nr:hypothetical protein [Verrucomicrobiae bacterium]